MKQQEYIDFIHTLLNNEEEFHKFKESYQQRIDKSIKIISSKISKDEFLKYVDDFGWELYPGNFSNGGKVFDDVLFFKKIDEKKTLGTHFLHESGFFYIQEMAAGLPAQVLNPESGDIVLDLCAAPGGKSVQLADSLIKSGGIVVSNELSSPRRKALIFNLNRCGLYNTIITGYDGAQIGDLSPETFDKVLVDAPCSGEGMQYKSDKSIRYRDKKNVYKLAKVQKQLLISGLKALKVGGELVYSTCTLNPFENEGVVSDVLSIYKDEIVLENVDVDQKSSGYCSFGENNFFNSEEDAKKLARFWPHIQKTGGFFIAKFRKNKRINFDKKEDRRALKPAEFDNSNILQERVNEYLYQYWGIKEDNLLFFSTKNAIYVTHKNAWDNASSLFKEKLGLPIIKLGREERIPQQGLISGLGKKIQKHYVELDNQSVESLSEKGEIPGIYGEIGEFLAVERNGKKLALVKQGNDCIKLKIN